MKITTERDNAGVLYYVATGRGVARLVVVEGYSYTETMAECFELLRRQYQVQ